MTIRDIEVKTGYPGRSKEVILSKTQIERKKLVEERGGSYDIIQIPGLIDPDSIQIDNRIENAMNRQIKKSNK